MKIFKNNLLTALFFLTSLLTFSQVGIGTTDPNANAVLEIESTTQGVAFPRMDTSQRMGITAPAKGLVVFDTDLDCIMINKGDTTHDWECMGASTLDRIGADADDETTATTVTAAQIAAIDGVTGVDPDNEIAYQNYIDSNPDLFSAPATVAEVQAMIDALAYPEGDATFVLPIDKKILSLNAENGGVGDIQGVVDNATNQVTFTVPYTAGSGEYAAYTSDPITVTGENGDSNTLTISYPSGTFATTGDITVTVSVAGADTSFDVIKQTAGGTALFGTFDFKVNGTSKGNLTLTALGGIPDRRFGDGSGHDFVYLEVTNPTTGAVWLNNNLGADYANINHASFDPTKQATAFDDFHAYGSQFQWGRYSDGHELINWTSATAGTAVNGATFTRSNSPGHGNFIIAPDIPNDWRVSQSSALWQGVAGVNNPCPDGYRVPTKTEFDTELLSWGTQNSSGAFNSLLKISLAGGRRSTTSGYLNNGTRSYYWSSTVVSTLSYRLTSESSSAAVEPSPRGNGFPVRCIKD